MDFVTRFKSALKSSVVFSERQEDARQALENKTRHTALVGGARAGKSWLIVRAIVAASLRAPGSRHAILRLHSNAARASISLDTLPTVMRKCFPAAKIEEHRQDGFFQFENGSQIWIGGLDDKDRVEKILGQEYLCVYLNEASQIPHESFLVAMTRLAQNVEGETQRCFVDLNPTDKAHWAYRLFVEKRDPISKRPLPNPDDYQIRFLNPRDNAANLSKQYLDSLANMPDRQRKRFYEGQFLDQLEGALWNLDVIERNRVDPGELPELERIVVAVDPAVSNHAGSDETGIVVVGRGVDGHGYVLEDASGKYDPTTWARKAVALYRKYDADRIIAEVNQGGALVESTLRAIDKNVPFKAVHASRGKILRAEPIAALAEQDKLHHAGVFGELEEQLTSFVPGMRGSPDRLDAMVYAATELLIDGGGERPRLFFGGVSTQYSRGGGKPAGHYGPTFAAPMTLADRKSSLLCARPKMSRAMPDANGLPTAIV